MTLTTRIPAVLDYLVTTFTAASTLGTANPPVAIYDGPVVTDEPSRLILWVGLDDPDGEGAPTAADSDSTWAALGGMARDEQLSIHCVAEAWSGDTDVRTIRVAAFGIVSAVENIIRANANLGGTLPAGWAEVTGMSLKQNNTTTGAVARVSFRIDCRARI
jgi:hypothetical protein